MNLFLVVGISLVCLASCAVVVPNKGYHAEIGIPAAEKLQALETQLLSTKEVDRIVGGVVSQINAHPYLAGLIISFVNIAGQSVCGSSLLTPSRLITAAHCWFDGFNQAYQFTVVLGSDYLFSGGTRISTTSVIMHPQWSATTLANDVAMILLPTNVLFGNTIQPVSLPAVNELYDSFAGEWSTAVGYGKTSDAQTGVTTSTMVSQVNLQVITVAQCQAVFGAWARDSNICTSGLGGVGICGGDSGGPLVVNRQGRNVLVGVSSFVNAAGCQLGSPSAFARITSFYSFITQYL